MAQADEARAFDDDPLVDGVDHVGSLLYWFGLLPDFGQGVEPLGRATRWQVPGRLRPHDFQISAEARHPREVFRVVEARRNMLQCELAHLAFEPGTIHGHGAFTPRTSWERSRAHVGRYIVLP